MYNSQYYTCEEIDQRLLQGYLDDFNYITNSNLTKEEFHRMLGLIPGIDEAFQRLLQRVQTLLSEGYLFGGLADIETDPGNPDGKVFYLVADKGSYIHFLNQDHEPLVFLTNGIRALYYSPEDDWQYQELIIIDDKPNANSNNLVTSGGVDAAIRSMVGYMVCDTAGNTAAKVITGNFYIIQQGGSLKVKFINKNTANDATLKIGDADAKPLYYANKRASNSNSWEAGEVVEIFYDGTNYYANNVAGGGNSGDGAFDISVFNAVADVPAEYNGFSAAVTDANVPEQFRKGGMTVRFIDSSKSPSVYVQYRLMKTVWSTTVTDWQGIDDKPTSNSNGIPNSGGTFTAIQNSPQLAYVVCDTAAATAAKTVELTGYILPTNGGSIKVKMTHKNTAANPTLNINGAGAKPLFYGGDIASDSNSWEDNEIVEVFYDGTNYQANNVAGGGGSAGAYDISEANSGASYDSLAAALGTNAANIPAAIRSGGMSIKYIDSTSNQYVQYRYMGTAVTDAAMSTVSNWQGVDTMPTPDSINTVESGGVADIFNKAFVNWRDQGGGGIQTLFSQVISSQTYINYDSVSLHEGDHIKFEASGGNGGDYTVYMYYTAASNPKAVLGTFNNQTPLNIQSISYGGYESYYRLLIAGTAGSVVTIKKLPSSPSGRIDLSEDLKISVQSMIDASVEEGVSGLEKYKDIIIADNITAATSILKSSDGLNGISIGDYLKVEVGNGTVGTWGLCKYDTAHTEGKVIYTESLEPNHTYYIKIIDDFFRLYFYKLNSCDAPLSAWRLSEVENKVINNSDSIKLLEQNTNYSYYFEKGNAPEKFTKTPCFIVAGQSNADGRVPVADLPSYVQFPMANVEAWGSVSFVELNESYLSSNRWAFDLITLYNASLVTPCKVVKYAVGATKLNWNLNGAAWTPDYEGLSNSLLLTLEGKVRNAVDSGAQIDLRAILWHQGEGDCLDNDAKDYYNNLKKLIAYLRGLCGNVKLPFISGTISHSSGQYNQIVEAAQLKVAAEDPYVTYIDMSGATLLDAYHFDAQSAEYLGKKVYDALIDYGIINGTKLNPTRPW